MSKVEWIAEFRVLLQPHGAAHIGSLLVKDVGIKIYNWGPKTEDIKKLKRR